MSGVNMLLSDYQAFSAGNGSEVRDLMERIYRSYCKKLDEKAGLRRKMQKRQEVVLYGSW